MNTVHNHRIRSISDLIILKILTEIPITLAAKNKQREVEVTSPHEHINSKSFMERLGHYTADDVHCPRRASIYTKTD